MRDKVLNVLVILILLVLIGLVSYLHFSLGLRYLSMSLLFVGLVIGIIRFVSSTKETANSEFGER